MEKAATTKDVLLNRMEHKYLCYFSNLDFNWVFFICNSHQYHIWFKRDRKVQIPNFIDVLWHAETSCHNYLNKMLNFYHIWNFIPKHHKNFTKKFINIKVKCLEKIGSAWFIYQKWQVISTIYKLFEYIFWWNCLEFSDKIDLTMGMTIFNNIK